MRGEEGEGGGGNWTQPKVFVPHPRPMPTDYETERGIDIESVDVWAVQKSHQAPVTSPSSPHKRHTTASWDARVTDRVVPKQRWSERHGQMPHLLLVVAPPWPPRADSIQVLALAHAG